MIAFLIGHAETLRKIAPLIIAALMIAAFCVLTANVTRTATSRHGKAWSAPRLQARSTGQHSAAHHRREYHAQGARHAAALTAARTT